MNNPIQPADLRFFVVLAGSGSLSAAGRELAITTAAVSKRLTQMEDRLDVALVNRTTRRMSMTPEGELYLEHARRIVSEIDGMEELLSATRATPKGLLRVNATLGFGRSHVAPLISRFIRKHPGVDVQLQLSVNPPAPSDDAYDVCIRFGAPPDSRVVARLLVPNRRLLCASPAYLARHGTPRAPRDLIEHQCIGIRQGEAAYGQWRLTSGRGKNMRTEVIKTHSKLTTNDGEIAVNWALDGHGILMRAEWDIRRHLDRGRLIEVLPHCGSPDADVYAIYPQRHKSTARVKAFVDMMALSLESRVKH
ncbi:MAG: LysR family transcriptional regulator [Burkholderiaceae bacterium]